MMPDRDRKYLHRWARDAGYSDFDTYIRAGGSILDLRRDITQRISELESTLRALDSYSGSAVELQHQSDIKVAVEHAGTIAEPDEPPDPHNAHPQGDDA